MDEYWLIDWLQEDESRIDPLYYGQLAVNRPKRVKLVPADLQQLRQDPRNGVKPFQETLCLVTFVYMCIQVMNEATRNPKNSCLY